jgi:hypothetical protein
MKIQIDPKSMANLKAELKDFSERRLNAAVATALTRTAVQVKKKIAASMGSSLNNPTPYTMRQLRHVGASADKLVAAVGFNVVAIQDERGNVIRYRDLGPDQTPAGKYMQFQAEGGRRRAKRFEVALQKVGVLPKGWVAVPGQRAKLDAYGNQSVGELRQILSWFDAAEMVAGSRQNMRQEGRDKRRKGTRKTAGFEYFVAPVGGIRTFSRKTGSTGTHKMQPGIYRRTTFAMGNRIEPVVIFVQRANYRKRFDFQAIGAAERDRVFPGEILRAVRESAARMRGAK